MPKRKKIAVTPLKKLGELVDKEQYDQFQEYLASKSSKEIRAFFERGVICKLSDTKNSRQGPNTIRAYYDKDSEGIAVEAQLNRNADQKLVESLTSGLTYSFGLLFFEVSILKKDSAKLKKILKQLSE